MKPQSRQSVVLIALSILGCSQGAAGRATATAGALAVTGAAASRADNTCYDSGADDPAVRDRYSFCTGARGTAKPEAAGVVLGLGLGAILAGKAIELNAQENASGRRTTALSGTLPGQESPAPTTQPSAPQTTTPASSATTTPVETAPAAPGPTRESEAEALRKRALPTPPLGGAPAPIPPK